jgi:hypothetical protein
MIAALGFLSLFGLYLAGSFPGPAPGLPADWARSLVQADPAAVARAPLYAGLARGFLHLFPFGNPAWRTAVFSALAGAAAAPLVAVALGLFFPAEKKISLSSVELERERHRLSARWMAALIAGTVPGMWAASLRTGPETVNLLLAVGFLCAFGWALRSGGWTRALRRGAAASFAGGVALGAESRLWAWVPLAAAGALVPWARGARGFLGLTSRLRAMELRRWTAQGGACVLVWGASLTAGLFLPLLWAYHAGLIGAPHLARGVQTAPTGTLPFPGVGVGDFWTAFTLPGTVVLGWGVWGLLRRGRLVLGGALYLFLSLLAWGWGPGIPAPLVFIPLAMPLAWGLYQWGLHPLLGKFPLGLGILILALLTHRGVISRGDFSAWDRGDSLLRDAPPGAGLLNLGALSLSAVRYQRDVLGRRTDARPLTVAAEAVERLDPSGWTSEFFTEDPASLPGVQEGRRSFPTDAWPLGDLLLYCPADRRAVIDPPGRLAVMRWTRRFHNRRNPPPPWLSRDNPETRSLKNPAPTPHLWWARKADSLALPRVAEKEYSLALLEDPGAPEALVPLGELALAEGRPREAEVYFRRALPRSPRDYRLRREWGRSLEAVGRGPAARIAWQNALAGDPEDALTRGLLADSLETSGHTEEARAHWKILSQRPGAGKTTVRRWLQLACGLGRTAEGEEALSAYEALSLTDEERRAAEDFRTLLGALKKKKPLPSP